jgi:peptidoglycan/LPS O-acetylase OafA/YrhL
MRAFNIPQLDGLRFVAFLMVFAFHSLPKTGSSYPLVGDAAALVVRGGHFGVDLFFALSSFLITTLLLREIESTGRLNVRAFYIRRALRIWPLFFAFLLFGTFFSGLIGLQQLEGSAAAAYLLFAGNWWVALNGAFSRQFFDHLWSLCVEEQFYLLWPPVVRRMGRRGIRLSALGLVALGLVSRAAFVALDFNDISIWTATLTRVDAIGVGILLATLPLPRYSGWIDLVWGVGLIIAGTAVSEIGLGWTTLAYLMVAVGCGGVVAGAIRLPAPPAWLVYLGRISYGLYVFHMLCLVLVMAHVPTGRPLPMLAGVGASLVLTILTASLSYQLYEKPFLKLKRRFEIIRSRSINAAPDAEELKPAPLPPLPEIGPRPVA